MITRRADEDAGSELTARGGVITDLREAGCPPGTQVTGGAAFLQYPRAAEVPQSDQTEIGQIADLLNALSLSFHGLTFRLTHNGREMLSRPATGRQIVNVSAWLGRETAEALLPVSLSTPGVTVSGFIGKPEQARANRSGQLFFVNGRRIVNRTLMHALEFPYQELLQPKQFPVAVLSVNLDPAQVDVNVHPAKAEVRFHREQEVHGVVTSAVRQALAGVSMIRELAAHRPGTAAKIASPGPVLPLPTGEAYHSPEEITPLPAAAPATSSGLRALGQLHNTYLIAEGRDGLLIISQHRAHERVIFERALAAGDRAEMQRLVLPVTLHMGYREAALLVEHLEELASCGFDIEALSGQSYLVRGTPAVLAGANPETAVREILADLDGHIALAPFNCDDPAQRPRQEGRRRLLAALACKAAMKAGKPLDIREQQQLLDQLAAADMPTLCPHGDPVLMTVSMHELDRKFER